MVISFGEIAISIVPASTRSAYEGLFKSEITFFAPIFFASIADNILASSELVNEQKTSTLSTSSSDRSS